MTPVLPNSGEAAEPFVIVAVGAHHSAFVESGAITDAKPEMGIGSLLFVQDQDGWATLHRAEGFSYRDGHRLVSFGPRIPWPDGKIAARQTGHIPSGERAHPPRPNTRGGG
jgi:hypothetical protein